MLALASVAASATQAQSAATPPTAAASAPTPPSVLQPVKVIGTRLTSDATVTEGTNSYAAPAATVGSKTPQTLRQTPQSVSVITQQRLQDQQLLTLDSALNQATGITVNNATNRSASFFARGFLVSTVQVDGIAVALPTNNYGFNSPDLAMYDHVEVLRGSAGLLSGAGTPGAVIGLARKRPTKQAQLRMNASLGSWDQKRVEVDGSAPLNADGSLRGRAVVLHEDRDFYYDVATQQRTVVYGVADYSFSPSTRASLGVSREEVKGRPLNGSNLPRYSNGADLKLPRSTFLGAAWNSERSTGTEAFADIEHQFNERWHAKLAVTQLLSDNQGKIGFLLGSIDPVTKAGAVQRGNYVDAEVRRRGADLMLDGRFEALGMKHEVVLGASAAEHVYDSEITALYNAPYTAVDIFSYNPYTVPEPATPAVASRPGINNQQTRQSGIYGTLRTHFTDSLTAVAGVRSSEWKFRQRNLKTGVEQSNYRDSATTPFLGAVYDISHDWSAYASYADSFVVQNLFGVDTKRLPPVTGVNYEAGLKGTLFDGRADASLAMFRINRKNIGQRDTVHTGPTECNGAACYVTGGETRSDGLEAEISGDLRPGWNLYAGYTYNTTKYVRDRTVTGSPSANEGQGLADWVPKHTLRVWSNMRLPGTASAWTVGAGVTAQSHFFRLLSGQLMNQSGYALMNARVGYQVDKSWSVALNANNVFDRIYYQRFNLLDQGAFYGEPRNFMLSARGAF